MARQGGIGLTNSWSGFKPRFKKISALTIRQPRRVRGVQPMRPVRPINIMRDPSTRGGSRY